MSGGKFATVGGMKSGAEVEKEMREWLAQNLAGYMGKRTSKDVAKGHKGEFSYKTIDRLLDQETYGDAGNLKTLARIAAALNIRPYQLLEPPEKKPLIGGQEKQEQETGAKFTDSAMQNRKRKDKK